MKRNIIQINQEKCNGCGLCVDACHEGALRLIDGKAQLISDSYCDGLGACLPQCPTDAITIEEREAAAFDEEMVKLNMEQKQSKMEPPACGCPGATARTIPQKPQQESFVQEAQVADSSNLRQWPCQIKLVPAGAPYMQNANLLIAADCTAYAYANFHKKFMNGKITLIGCPKLDEGDYSEKLTDILMQNDINSITTLRMEVPCCGGIVHAVKNALKRSGKIIPWKVVTISTDGEIIEEV